MHIDASVSDKLRDPVSLWGLQICSVQLCASVLNLRFFSSATPAWLSEFNVW